MQSGTERAHKDRCIACRQHYNAELPRKLGCIEHLPSARHAPTDGQPKNIVYRMDANSNRNSGAADAYKCVPKKRSPFIS